MCRLPLVIFFPVVIALFFSPSALCAQQSPYTPDVTGTAFFVSDNGIAVTNYHVIQESRQVLLFDPHADSRIQNEHARGTRRTSPCGSRAFNTSSALWIGLQSGRDQWDAEHTPGDWQKIKTLTGAPATASDQTYV